jgi:hypothetical protein
MCGGGNGPRGQSTVGMPVVCATCFRRLLIDEHVDLRFHTGGYGILREIHNAVAA